MPFNVEKVTPIAIAVWRDGRYLFRLDVLVQAALLVLLAAATGATIRTSSTQFDPRYSQNIKLYLRVSGRMCGPKLSQLHIRVTPLNVRMQILTF